MISLKNISIDKDIFDLNKILFTDCKVYSIEYLDDKRILAGLENSTINI